MGGSTHALTGKPATTRIIRPSLFTVATAAALFVILLAACSSAGPTGTPGPTTTPTPAPLIAESIPGSQNHSPDGTWWGYNQSKLTRIGDTVFIYAVENDDDPATESAFVIYSKTGDEAWARGPSFPTSRPGNLVATPDGVFHAFVYDPVDVLENDSRGESAYLINNRGGRRHSAGQVYA
jgi:hypothetical protein